MIKKKVVLSIAGSDSSGGAGIQADLKTFEAFGLFGTSAITVLTAQNTQGVTAIEALPVDFVLAQIKAVFDDFEVAAVKIGMLFDKTLIEAIENVIKDLDIPIVVDPVCISKAGSPLLHEDAILVLKSLCRHASIITPNNYEVHALFQDKDTLQALHDFPTPVLVKQDTQEEKEIAESIDTLYHDKTTTLFTSPKVETTNLHGTGCSLSSAIAANLALGHSLEESIGTAKAFIYQALLHAPKIGHGPGPIAHKESGEYLATHT